MFIGRHDYAVRSLHASTQEETWNATYARLITLAPGGEGLREFLRDRGPRGAATSGLLPSTSQQQGLGTLPRLAVGADNALQAFDPGSGFQAWRMAFPTPPVAVYSPSVAGEKESRKLHSQRLALLPLPLPHSCVTAPAKCLDAALRPSASSALALLVDAGTNLLRPWEGVPTGKRRLGGRTQSSVLIGELRGSLYALPAEHLVLSPVRVQWPCIRAQL